MAPVPVAFADQSPFRGVDSIMRVPVIQVSLSRVPQWSTVINQHAREIRNGSSAVWQEALTELQGVSGAELLTEVNAYFNQARYIADAANYHEVDHWATPTTLLTRGGDCEEYALAKYLMLLELGVSPQDMRVVIMRASAQVAEHSVLLVATSGGTYVLDNLRRRPYAITSSITSSIAYGVNPDGMWLSLGGLTVAAR